MIINDFKIVSFVFDIDEKGFAFAFYGENGLYSINSNDNDIAHFIRLKDVLSKKDVIFVGYDNIHWENPIGNYIFDAFNSLKGSSINFQIQNMYSLSKRLKNESSENWEDIKYGNNFSSIDLSLMLFSKKNRIPKDKFINENSDYKALDIASRAKQLYEIAHKYSEDIQLRIKYSKEYKLDLLDCDYSKCGIKILSALYKRSTGSELNKIGYYDASIKIKDIVKYEGLKDTDFFNSEICNNSKFQQSIQIGNNNASIDAGGIRMSSEPQIFKDCKIVKIDVSSMFPSICLNNKIKPNHISDDFFAIYSTMFINKIKANGVSRAFWKGVINSILGQFNMPDNWLYSPETSMKIRMTAVDYMYELACFLNDHEIIGVNIDSITVKTNDIENTLKKVDEWGVSHSLRYKYFIYNAMLYENENNFIAIDQFGKHIFSGKYNSQSIAKIIPTLVATNLSGINNIESQISLYRDAEYFVFTSNIPSEYKAIYDCMIIDNNNKVYYSNSGSILMYKNEKNAVKNVYNSRVRIINDSNSFNRKLVYDKYYVSKAMEILNKFKYKQLTLF